MNTEFQVELTLLNFNPHVLTFVLTKQLLRQSHVSRRLVNWPWEFISATDSRSFKH